MSAERDVEAIRTFTGKHRFLSNFWRMPNGTTVEHWFQASKTLDPVEQLAVLSADSPGAAKKLGRRVALRGDWEQVKHPLMADFVAAKFEFPELRERLLATGSALLVEGNRWHDNVWGSCSCGTCGDRGANALGAMLMAVRATLRLSVEP